MEIRLYNSEMYYIGPIENQTSLIWNRKYFEPGTFELHVPITDDNLLKLKPGNIICKRGSKEAGVIEDLQMEDNHIKNEITAKGRFLSSYMDRRLIKATVSFNGKTELAMRQLLSGVTSIPLVELGNLNGFSQTVSFQATYKNLLSYESKLAKSANLGFRFSPNFEDRKLLFEIYEGVDRTKSQQNQNRVIFSESYDNLHQATYKYNDQTYRTVAYVGGEGDGDARTYVTVGEASGLDLREVFVDAKDVQSDKVTHDEYISELKQRGEESLSANSLSKSFECETGADVNFVYMQNYDLGDIVTVRKNQWNYEENFRITELQETYEFGHMTVSPTFGDPLPETIDWSDQ